MKHRTTEFTKSKSWFIKLKAWIREVEIVKSRNWNIEFIMLKCQSFVNLHWKASFHTCNKKQIKLTTLMKTRVLDISFFKCVYFSFTDNTFNGQTWLSVFVKWGIISNKTFVRFTDPCLRQTNNCNEYLVENKALGKTWQLDDSCPVYQITKMNKVILQSLHI